MTISSRRLATDAEIVLRNAGYFVNLGASHRSKATQLMIEGLRHPLMRLQITEGTVDNTEVERLLADAVNG